MPIRFEQPAPMDVNAAKGAGRAQVMGQNNSVLAGLMRSVADAYQARNQNATAIQLQSLRNQQSGLETAYQGEQANYRTQMGLAQQDAESQTRADAMVAAEQIQAGARQAMQTAEFTQADKIRLQKYQSGRAWVDSYAQQNNLGPDDPQVAELYAMIAAGEEPLKIRESQSKERWYAEKQKQTMQAAELAARAGAFQKETDMKQRDKYTSPVYDPQTWNQVEGELSQRWAAENEQRRKVGLPPIPEAARQNEITKEVTTRGGQQGMFVPTAKGMEFVPNPGYKGGGKADKKEEEFDWVGNKKQAEINAELEVPIGDESEELVRKPKRAEAYQRIMHDRLKSFQSKQGGGGQSQPQQVQPQAPPVGNSPPAGQGPPPVQPKQYATPEEWQKDVPGTLEQKRYEEAKSQLSGLSDEQRTAAMKDLDRSRELTIKNMGPPKSGPDAEEFQQLKTRLQPVLQKAASESQAGMQKSAEAAQSLLNQRIPWEQAEKALKDQGFDPAPYKAKYIEGLDYQKRLEAHRRGQATRTYTPSHINPTPR